ncbi:MAG TPA: metal ABC transporter permease [Candidatus Eisenbacteria bacterium]|nr:metal ABC transporter permease [Candidatus Eisenbacteria bacterium]
MSGFFGIMTVPFLACLVLAGIHAYLGLHVIEREIIFVDLALAQIAILGATIGYVCGHGLDSAYSYWLSLGFTLVGATIFSLTRYQKQRIPQEAIIGITYAVSAALMFLLLSRSGEGDEHLRAAIVGNVLLVTPAEVLKIAVIYSAIGVFHFVFRGRFLAVSKDHVQASKSLNVRFWDFLFYASFGVVVTSSVAIAGVLLVFSFLVVPAACAVLFADSVRSRLAIGWTIGFLGSVAGITASYVFDLPTGASVVCAFGGILLFLSIVKKVLTEI